MTIESKASVFPGRVRQFGFIVPDLDAELARWVDLGVAPWMVVRELRMERCCYRGDLSEPVISIAMSNSGDMQIELIQQHDETPSIYREFMTATGGGFNQIAYWVEDVNAVRARQRLPLVGRRFGGGTIAVRFSSAIWRIRTRPSLLWSCRSSTTRHWPRTT